VASVVGQTMTIYLIMVLTPWGWKRIGKPYRSKEAAQSWRSFAKNANYGRRSRVDRVDLPIVAPGKTSKKAQKLMDEKYNIDVEA